MRTVRIKLVALVLACVAPAIVGAVLRSRGAERDMLEQVERRVNGTNRRFAEELDESQANARLALSLAEHAVRFQQALAAHDAAGADRMVKLIAEAYSDRIVLASDARGVVLARGGASRGPASLGPESSPAFAGLLAGQPLADMIELRFNDGPGYALVSAAPVREGDAQVGAIALLTPITGAYLEHLEPKLNADLSVRVNEKVVAACPDHPAPDLESHADTAVLKEVGGKVFALKTFRPEKLQHPDMEVEITASRDVTELRDQVRRELRLHLGGLAVVLVVVLALALRFASRMGGTVRSISEAAGKVKGGHYVNVPVIRTRRRAREPGPRFQRDGRRSAGARSAARDLRSLRDPPGRRSPARRAT